MADGFLGRWAKRKEAVRRGEAVAEEPPVVEAKAVEPSPQPSPASRRGSETAPPEAPEPPPTLEDTHSLTPASDFTRFTRPDVPGDVKNAAFKKLFSDPHFNVMDGLDVYIDDYNKPDPLPPEMLRNLASAKFLGLFDDEEREQQHGESADHAGAQNVAQSVRPAESAVPPAEDHADPDLRLQQDDAPGPAGPGEDPR